MIVQALIGAADLSVANDADSGSVRSQVACGVIAMCLLNTLMEVFNGESIA